LKTRLSEFTSGSSQSASVKRMRVDLESLKGEILAHLQREDFAVFLSDGSAEGINLIYWDTKRSPDFRGFLDAAGKTGVKLIVFYEHVFSQDGIDETLERLEESDLGREEKRSYELRLRDLQKYEGFSCELQLYFEYINHVYVYQARTDWYEDFEDIFADVTVGESEDFEDDEEEGPIPGYFSRN
jgi:hypothetical protein